MLMNVGKKETRHHFNGELHDKIEKSAASKPKRWTRVHQILHDDRGVRYFFVAIFIIIATGVGLLAMLAQYEDPKIITLGTIIRKKIEQKYYSPLTGNEVVDETATKRAVTGIMIENSTSARPQSGLKDSGVVFEAIAEGGITRFLAIYQQEQPALIGPVRSVRPYYVDWIAAFDASVAHIGGSYNALKEVRNGQYRDIDQFFNSGSYWRAKDRKAPHNVYTSFEKLNALNEAKGYKESTFTGFNRVSIEPEKKTTKKKVETTTPEVANQVQVNISGVLYNSSYSYNTSTNTYDRSQAGAPHTDREAGQISPRVVIVMKVPTKLGFEDGYREQMTTIGTGEAHIFQKGTHIAGTWKKDDKKSQIKFLDNSSKEIPLERGQTWITAIAPGKNVTWQ
ncbi:hypothetical protein A3F64_02205 [Candidatus Saccharibacteria bacterium RIFCSPHIGHO2_12_FULL_42_8]|nr:MAG: hypothetical protein A3F64_02205 [Candidatus Saccharibacteria bacterium RIFCSPHIGHO2_12_FULL_42_8]